LEVKSGAKKILIVKPLMHVPPKYITTTFRPLLVRYVNNMLNICEISAVTNIIITNPALPDSLQVVTDTRGKDLFLGGKL